MRLVYVSFIIHVATTSDIQSQNVARIVGGQGIEARIVGGQGIEITEAPYQVALLKLGRHVCGGSIITENNVLTAAHCVQLDFIEALSYQVRVGSTYRNKGGNVYPVGYAIIHPNFTLTEKDYDVAILWLQFKIKFSNSIKPIQMKNDGEEVPDGATTIVTGWGTLKENGSVPEGLQKVSLLKIKDQDCIDVYRSTMTITPRMLCAEFPGGGKDSCQGDSGGPLVHDNKLAGIVSWGTGCARAEYPGVYSRVSALRKWIDKHIAILHFSQIQK